MQEELTLNIEGLSSSGYGIAKNDGLVVFVENSCPGDIAKVKITKKNKNYANAVITELITPSPHRTQPFCALHKVCGACRLQFIDYDYQLELKRQIVADALKTIGQITDIEVKPTIPSPVTQAYRHKIQYPVSQTKVSKRIIAGYYKTGTHETVNIKHCPLQPEICDRIIDFIRTRAFDYGISGYNEKKHNGDLRHVIIRTSAATGKNLVVLVVNSSKVFDRLNDFALAIFAEFKEVSGVCVNFNTKKTNVILGEISQCVAGKDFIKERILEKTFRIGANTFFQINPASAENIFRHIKTYLNTHFDSPVILDAYAGITAIGICVSDVCKKVVSVEENKQSCELAKLTLEANNIDNVEIFNMDAAKFFEREKRRFDAVILDPPRKGCSPISLDNALRLSKSKIIYVSCNPATLARDLKYLTSKGARIELVQPFDMFCHTHHVETLAIIDVSAN